MVQWSHDLLDDDEQTMLRRLGVFAGGFDVADVPTVTWFDEYEAFDLVDALAAKSLVDTGRHHEGRQRRGTHLGDVQSSQ